MVGQPGAKLHLYGKSDARPGRKMGHVNCIGERAEDAQRAFDAALQVLHIAP